jgi:hypothetical protein
VLESSQESGEPLTFEVGAGEVMGNKLFQVSGPALSSVLQFREFLVCMNREALSCQTAQHVICQGFDEAIRGLAVGQATIIEVSSSRGNSYCSLCNTKKYCGRLCKAHPPQQFQQSLSAH